MDLILWRHADAEDGIPDAERRLTPRGLKQAVRMAAWLSKHLPDQAAVISSPAVRAVQTARALTDDFTVDRSVGTDATPESVLKIVRRPQGARAVVVVGHQPTLGAVAALALTGRALPWSVKKGAIWWLHWRAGDEEPVLRAVIAPDHL